MKSLVLSVIPLGFALACARQEARGSEPIPVVVVSETGEGIAGAEVRDGTRAVLTGAHGQALATSGQPNVLCPAQFAREGRPAKDDSPDFRAFLCVSDKVEVGIGVLSSEKRSAKVLLNGDVIGETKSGVFVGTTKLPPRSQHELLLVPDGAEEKGSPEHLRAFDVGTKPTLVLAEVREPSPRKTGRLRPAAPERLELPYRLGR